MVGVKADQVALYMKDMYKAEREGYKEEDTGYNKVLKVVNSVKGAGDKMTQILGADALTRHTVDGQDINFRTPVQGWEYLVKYWTYSDGLAFNKEAVEDTVKLGNLLKDMAQTWGIQVRIAKEEMASRIFNKGGDLLGDWVFNGTHTGNTDSSADLLYDGLPFFNLTGNKRTSKGRGTYYNSVASLTVTPANFETLYNLQVSTNNRNERDQVVRNTADTILCRPGSDRFKADRIVDTQRGMPGGELNDSNPYYKLVSVIDWDYLETTAGFFVGKKQHDGIQFHERQSSEIRFFRDETNLGYKASINIRIGILVKTFKAWVRGGGTST